MSEVVVFRPDLQKCIESYSEMIDSFAGLPEEMLVSGALDYAKTFPDPESNPWIQALALKNEELAKTVKERIEKEGQGKPRR